MNLHKPNKTLSAVLGTALLAAAAGVPAAGAVEPFSADYTANYMGMQGAGHMSIAPAGNGRWKYSMDIRSKVAQLSQSTTFDEKGGKLRPLSGTDSSLLLIKKSSKSATYDWTRGEARWSGDVKSERAGPVKLQAGDLDAMLVNLAVARDAAKGEPMTYRMVDDGRVKQLTWQVAGKESLTIGGKTAQATKVTRTDGDKQTVVWVIEGLPLPARILQRKDGRDEIDLTINALK